MKSLKPFLKNISLATRIRASYIIVTLPVVIFTCIILYTLSVQNKRYDELINDVDKASQFSLDFKKDFDYEIYLVIVESKSFADSELNTMLSEATAVVDELSKNGNVNNENAARLEDVRKYLRNLGTYASRIEKNLADGDKYEENIEIWENDVQIVTYLVRETILQFIYYELQDIRQSRAEINNFYNKVFSYSIIAAIAVVLLFIFISYAISQSITKPVRELSKITEKVSRGDLSVRSEIDIGSEIGILSTSFNEMIDRLSHLLNQVRIEQESLRKAELELLQAQINPHFLYNTLDTIVWLAEANDQTRVVSMVGSLSKFFRTSLGQGKDEVTVRDELDHVRSYLEIQQVRYQDILDYSIEVPQELYDSPIPKITLQPLVENALYHGIKNKRGMGKIRITGKSENKCIYLYIEDNGIGMTEERLKLISNRINTDISENGQPEKGGVSGELFGLSNVNERIKLKYGQRYGIHIDSTYGEGTTVTILLPLS
ncbi:MAG: sensor histidine kinase [Lachnospiraceae bacterium]|nr:sensor histidine kinase [Lachnospiraceae bacterium]